MVIAMIPSVVPQPASSRNGGAMGGATAKATTTT
jgi:hypothetical protein